MARSEKLEQEKQRPLSPDSFGLVVRKIDETLEFFSIVVPDGAFTSNLQHLQIGDELYLEKVPYGFLTLARYQLPAPKDLWSSIVQWVNG